MTQINDPFLHSLIARLNQPGVIGLALVGSYSRDAQTQYSDVDVEIFVEELPEEPYTLRFLDGKLVSLKSICLRDEFSSLTKPEEAVWAVPGLRRMKILLDERGELDRLKQAALDFKWEALQPAADEYAAEELMGCAEEAHKLMGGLVQQNESKVLYAAWGMFKNLTAAVIVQKGLLIESENLYLAIPQNHFGGSHLWTRAFRLSFGMDVEAGVPAWRTRGLASLDLYEQTALLFKDIIPEKHRQVIGNTLQLIATFKTKDEQR